MKATEKNKQDGKDTTMHTLVHKHVVVFINIQTNTPLNNNILVFNSRQLCLETQLAYQNSFTTKNKRSQAYLQTLAG